MAGGQISLPQSPYQIDSDDGVHVVGNEPVVVMLDGLGVVMRVRVHLDLYITMYTPYNAILWTCTDYGIVHLVRTGPQPFVNRG